MTHQGSENGASEVRERSLLVVIVRPPQRIGFGVVIRVPKGKFSVLFRKDLAYLKLPQVRACSMPSSCCLVLNTAVALPRGREDSGEGPAAG